jgi:hypothetical protein
MSMNIQTTGLDIERWNKFQELVLHIHGRSSKNGTGYDDPVPDDCLITHDQFLNSITRELVVMVYESDSLSQADDPGHVVWDLLRELVEVVIGLKQSKAAATNPLLFDPRL